MSNDAKTKERLRIAVFFGLCILLIAGIFVSIGSGTVSLSVSETWAALMGEADADGSAAAGKRGCSSRRSHHAK